MVAFPIKLDYVAKLFTGVQIVPLFITVPNCPLFISVPNCLWCQIVLFHIEMTNYPDAKLS